jgi:branched-chain amino acid transport system substrate-binding protein
VKDAGSDETDTVVEKMRAAPIHDAAIPNGKILENGSIVHDVFLAEVKSPDESKGEWDYYKILRTIPGDQAFLSVEDSGCKLGS